MHLWDPSWDEPKIIDVAAQLPGGKTIGKTVGRWLNVDSPTPTIFFSDSQDCTLASLSGPDASPVPWDEAEAPAFDIYGQREESPLNLIPADEKRAYHRVSEIFGGRWDDEIE